MVPERTVERLNQYCQLLADLAKSGTETIFSHELAELAGATPAQVRRDLMVIELAGQATRGYDVKRLQERLSEFLYTEGGDKVALVGVGNIGRALLPYFLTYRPGLRIVVSFDKNKEKKGRLLHGCLCRGMDELEKAIRNVGIRIAILAIPAEDAQEVAERLCNAGITGILNFAPRHLMLPDHVWVENIHMGVVLEKVAFMARESLREQEEAPA